MSEEEGRQYAADIGALYVETSALTSEGVAEAFKDIVRYDCKRGVEGVVALGGYRL